MTIDIQNNRVTRARFVCVRSFTNGVRSFYVGRLIQQYAVAWMLSVHQLLPIDFRVTPSAGVIALEFVSYRAYHGAGREYNCSVAQRIRDTDTLVRALIA